MEMGNEDFGNLRYPERLELLQLVLSAFSGIEDKSIGRGENDGQRRVIPRSCGGGRACAQWEDGNRRSHFRKGYRDDVDTLEV